MKNEELLISGHGKKPPVCHNYKWKFNLLHLRPRANKFKKQKRENSRFMWNVDSLNFIEYMQQQKKQRRFQV